MIGYVIQYCVTCVYSALVAGNEAVNAFHFHISGSTFNNLTIIICFFKYNQALTMRLHQYCSTMQYMYREFGSSFFSPSF